MKEKEILRAYFTVKNITEMTDLIFWILLIAYFLGYKFCSLLMRLYY